MADDLNDLLAKARKYEELGKEATQGPWQAKSTNCKCMQCAYGSVWAEEDDERFTVATQVQYYCDAMLIEAAPEMAELLGRLAGEVELLRAMRVNDDVQTPLD